MSSHTPRSRQRRSPAEIHAILRRFRDSGRSRTGFAREHGIAASTFDLWLRKYGAAIAAKEEIDLIAVTFPVAPAPVVVAPTTSYEVIFPSGVRIAVPRGFCAEELPALIAAVAQC
jgi:hypothetical protein